MRRARAIALSCVLVLVAACSGDGEGGGELEGDGEERGGDDTMVDEAQVVDDITVEVTATAGDRHVAIDFTVTNVGSRPVAVVDPGEGGERATALGGGAIRVTYLGPEGDPGGGAPIPPGEAVLLAPGASHRGTARALTRGDELPGEIEVCVEVVADFYADGDGDGRVTFPHRQTTDAPVLACSGRVAVA